MTVLTEKNCRSSMKSIVSKAVWRDQAHFGGIMTQPAVSKLRILQASPSDASRTNSFLMQQVICDDSMDVLEETCFEEGYAVG